jgi:hypothetical protein
MQGKTGKLLAVALLALVGTASSVSAAPAVPGGGAAPVAPRHPGPDPTFPPIASWRTVFDDEFNGTFNGQTIVDTKRTDGTSCPGTPCDGVDDRVWKPLPYHPSTAAAVSTTSAAPGGTDPGQPADGYLNMRTYTDAGVHKFPGWLTTGDNTANRLLRFESTYGYMEARIRMGDTTGLGTSFWTYSRDLYSDGSKPLRDPAHAGAEIDIVEHTDSDTGATHGLHWDGYSDMHGYDGTNGVRLACPHVASCLGGFHTWGVLWDPTGYTYFVDGHEMPSKIVRGISHHPLFLVLGFGVEGSALGDASTQNYQPFGNAANPLTLVDYVKVWQPVVSDIPDQTLTRDVPVAVPFAVSSYAGAAGVPGPLPVTTVEATVAPIPPAVSQDVLRNQDLKITGTGADRTLGIMTKPGGSTGGARVTVTAKNGATVVGSDTFDVQASGTGPTPVDLATTTPPNLTLTTGPPAAVRLRTTTTGSGTFTFTATSSNQDLLPDGNLAFSGDAKERSLSITLLPTRNGSADVTVVVKRDGTTVNTRTFEVTVGNLLNAGFEAGLAPWNLLGGTGAPAAGAAHAGAQGFHMGVGVLTQTIAVEPNTTYVLGAWGRSSAAGGTFNIAVPDTDIGLPGNQTANLSFTTTSWANKEVVFTTGRWTTQVEVWVSNFGVSSIGFDADDISLGYGPQMQDVPLQSIGHNVCVRPVFNVGRLGGTASPTVSASITGGTASLLTGLAVEVANTDPWPSGSNAYRRALKITPTTTVTQSGEVTVTVVTTDPAGRQVSQDVKVVVNAGTFHNGGFTYDPFADASSWMYPGCSPNPAPLWNKSAASGVRWDDTEPYDPAVNGRSKGLDFTNGLVTQAVTGLEPNTVYTLKGWLRFRSGTSGAAGLQASGDVSPLPGGSTQFLKTSGSWEQGTVTFRTGTAGTASVQLFSLDPAAGVQIHDVTLVKVP